MKILDAIINWLEKDGRPIWYIVLLILALVYVAMNYCDFILLGYLVILVVLI